MNQNSIIRDFTTGSVPRLLLWFSLPLMASNLLQTLYNMVDMVVIGQFVGKVGLSAVSIGGDVLNLMTFLVMGLAGAGQVILAQYIGAGRRDRIRRVVGTMFTVILAGALVLSVLVLLLTDQILAAMQTPDEAWAFAQDYIRTCATGLVFIYGYNLVSAILRGMGDSRHPLLFIAVATVVNLVLDLIFVAGVGMGPMGAALATVIGQGVSFLWALVFLYRRRAQFGFDFHPASFRVDGEILARLLKLGIPMSLQYGAIMFSMLFVNAFLNSYGVVASAVTGVGNKLGSVASVVSGALSQGGSSLVGQNIGARRYDRVSRIVGISALIGLTFSVTLSLVTIFFPRTVFGLFNREKEVLDMAMTYIPCAVMLFLGFAARAPFNALINGVGNAKLNLTLGLLDGIVCRVGLALLLGVAAGWGIQGFWYGNALAGYVPFFVGGIYYCSGLWRRSGVVVPDGG